MRAMGRREVEIGWVRLWRLPQEELGIRNLLSHEVHRSITRANLFDEISNLQGRNICRHLDKLVFNSTDADYINEREIILTRKKSKLNKRFQNEAEIQLVNASFEDYLKISDTLLPSMRAF
jgi:hypothetical protein